jgi:preprotein translocase subunit YajC
MLNYMMILIYAAIIGGMWFILVRPQQKRDKENKKMRESVEVGDEIVTIGGICGKVVTAKEDTLVIEVGADKVKLKIARWAVGKVENKK